MIPPTSLTRLAVLIDADNIHHEHAKYVFEEIARYGTATIRRAYGNWTGTGLQGWKGDLHRLAIQPMQQFSNVGGKNATDAALIIDAMDILHAGNVEGFCLVSSDSDFTRLATRIRESGRKVFGFGERKTPDVFVSACDKFIRVENLHPEPGPASTPGDKDLAGLKRSLLKVVEDAAREDGWTTLSAVGSLLMKGDPSFDPRDYSKKGSKQERYKSLGDLVKDQSYLEWKPVPDPNGHIHVHVKAKTPG